MPKTKAQKRNLKTELRTLIKMDNGSYALKATEPRGLVLSGGGAKGAMYSGMIRAMYERGIMQALTHVAGASAGAMTASLVALGMSHENIRRIIHEVKAINILDGGISNAIAAREFRIRSTGRYLRGFLEVLYVYTIQQHLMGIDNLAKVAQDDCEIIHQKLNDFSLIFQKHEISIQSLDDVIGLINTKEGLKKLKAYPEANMPHITFEDLNRLRNILPEHKKYLIKNLTVVTTNQSKNKKSNHNEKLTPEDSIAQSVQHSAAHPFLFVPEKNSRGDFLADGGISDNMPTKALRDYGLKNEQIICARVLNANELAKHMPRIENRTPEKLNTAWKAADTVLTRIFGGHPVKGLVKVINREKIFYYLGNMLYLNGGSLKTTSIALTENQKRQADHQGYIQTNTFLNAQAVQYFDNPLMAILYLDGFALDELAKSPEEDLVPYIDCAKIILDHQHAATEAFHARNYNEGIAHIKQIEATLEANAVLNKTQKSQALALSLKQIDYLSDGKLEKYIVTQKAQETPGTWSYWLHKIWLLLKAAYEWVFGISTPKKATLPEPLPDATPQVSTQQLFTMFYYKAAPESPSEPASPGLIPVTA